MFPLVAEAIGNVLPLQSLRYIGLAHVEADEMGSLNQFLAAAPRRARWRWPARPRSWCR
jgi:flavorubredoxin